LDTLETAGIRVLYDKAVQLLKDAGCRMKEGNVVQIPNWLVEECIRSRSEGAQAIVVVATRYIFETWITILVMYMVLTLSLSLVAGQLEKKDETKRLNDPINAERNQDFSEKTWFLATMSPKGASRGKG